MPAAHRSGTVNLTSVVTQPGATETETVTWALTDNGDMVQTGTGTDFSFSIPERPRTS